ncbi:hypothetical protein Pmar_PMAR019689, partial [Perkinsus marinus ATCC 50983]
WGSCHHRCHQGNSGLRSRHRRSGMPADCSESGPSASGRGLDRDAPTHTQCTTCDNADSAELYRPYGLGLM